MLLPHHSRPARVGCGMAAALALVAVGVGGVGLAGWLLATGHRTDHSLTTPTTRTRATNKADDPENGKTPPPPVDDGVVRGIRAWQGMKGDGQYLYLSHQHPGEPLQDVSMTVEFKGSSARKTTTHPEWEAGRALRVEFPALFGKNRRVHVTGTAAQGARPLRIDAEVEIEAAAPTPGGKKAPFNPPVPGATTPTP